MTLKIFRSGPEQVVTYADNQMAGVDVGFAPVKLAWGAHRNARAGLTVRFGDWASGLYYAELTSSDGRVGYAPFVIHPAAIGTSSRVAVVLPTYSWQAYNFYDANGDGWGDTWYAGPPNYTVDLSRPYNNKGAMPRFYRYDLPFLHWLFWSGRQVEFLSDADLDAVRTGDELAHAYDLILFEGHEEYVPAHMFDTVTRYRDLGGNLMFLSANNFFWRVSLKGTVLRKTAQFRQVGKPESALAGVQYRANDHGEKQGNYVVASTALAPWLWDGTGIADGGTFGSAVGGFGIEIDTTTPATPPGTQVLADDPRPVRAWVDSADDVLRVAVGREGVLRRCARLRRVSRDVALAADPAEPLRPADRPVATARSAADPRVSRPSRSRACGSRAPRRTRPPPARPLVARRRLGDERVVGRPRQRRRRVDDRLLAAHRVLDPGLLLALEERVVLERILVEVARERHLRLQRGVPALELEVILDDLRELRGSLNRHAFDSSVWCGVPDSAAANALRAEGPSVAPRPAALCRQRTAAAARRSGREAARAAGRMARCPA